MEIIMDNGNLKGSENQASGSNYTCRIPRDLNIGSGSVARNKGENDVRLLVACKTQLSSEVIKWKTESLRLQKERDSAQIRMKELDQAIGKFCERNKELESRLLVAEEENKKLRSKMYGSPTVNALQKLSTSLNKYHSYPWAESVPVPPTCSNSDQISTEVTVPQEDWRDVSQKLLEKMKQEMKELQEIGSNFSLSEFNVDEGNLVGQESSGNEVCDDKIEDSLSSLITETESLKHCLLEQRKNLKTVITKFMLDNPQISKELKESTRIKSSPEKKESQSVKPKIPFNQSSRHSDDSFRAFFTKHLENCQNIDKMSKTMQLFVQSNLANDHQSDKAQKMENSASAHPVKTDKNTGDKRTAEDDRTCPICQEVFDHSIPQNKFEEHVLDHLEEESASLLDQYVVV